MKEYLRAFSKYGVFSGRASRKEFWMFELVHSLILVGLYFGFYFVFDTTNSSSGWVVFYLYAMGAILPHIAVMIRRMHDTNRSAVGLLLLLIPPIDQIFLIFVLTRRGTADDNDYGPAPERQVGS